MPAPSGDIHRSRAIDGIRGLAALSVLVFHVWLYRENRPMGERTLLFDHVSFQLHLGLICFFTLSGFLLYRAFAKAALRGGPAVSTRSFALRRVARIVPAYYVCIAGCIALYALVGLEGLTPTLAELPLHLGFAQNYSMATIMELNPVTWTLVVEAAFYVTLPFVGLAALAIGRRPAAQAALLLGLIAFSIAWTRYGLQTRADDVFLKALPSFLGVFATGMLAALWLEWRRAEGRPILTARATAALAAAGALLVLAHASWSETPWALDGWRGALRDLPAGVGFAVVIGAVAAGRGRVVHGLGWRPLAGAGMISYGIYLWHLPLLLVVRKAGLLPEPFAPRLGVVLALSILFGWLSWRLVERPAIAWAHRRTARPALPAAPPQPALVPPEPEPARA
jgi:peptidoglycan/LPS O-acetylase OafA/YrhL